MLTSIDKAIVAFLIAFLVLLAAMGVIDEETFRTLRGVVELAGPVLGALVVGAGVWAAPNRIKPPV